MGYPNRWYHSLVHMRLYVNLNRTTHVHAPAPRHVTARPTNPRPSTLSCLPSPLSSLAFLARFAAAAGYVAVDVLLARPEFGDLELANIQEIVAANAKQRFGMEERETGWYIRANQGHSMVEVNADELYLSLPPPPPPRPAPCTHVLPRIKPSLSPQSL